MDIGNSNLKEKYGRDLEQLLSDPQGLNSYSYVKNNPLKYVDKDGECALLAAFAIAGVIDLGIQVGRGLYNGQSFNESWGNVQWNQVIGTAMGGVLLEGALSGVAATGVLSKVSPFSNLGKTEYQIHHIATNKSGSYTGITGQFEKIFQKAGVGMDDAINKVPVLRELHIGRHTNEYHQYVLQKLESSVQGLQGQEYTNALRNALNGLKQEITNNPNILKSKNIIVGE